MSLVTRLDALRAALGAALHNINTRLSSFSLPAVPTLSAVAEALPAVYAAGRTAEWDAFWEIYQEQGQRTDYSTAFSGIGWEKENFHPRYPVKVVNGYMLFRNNEHLNAAMLAQASLDFRGCETLQYGFMSCTALEGIDNVSVSRNADSCFLGCSRLHAVTNFGLPTAENGVVSNLFWNCPALEHLTLIGTLRQGNLGLQKSTKLDRESIVGLIGALSDAVTGQTLTLSKMAVDKAFETAAGAADGSASAAWTELLATKPHWEVTLA